MHGIRSMISNHITPKYISLTHHFSKIIGCTCTSYIKQNLVEDPKSIHRLC
uniref:Uncharacterized protein n=1 Tax=Arundo donax TaxID=35708 RepID=A0A0A9ABD3_ARUDO